MRLVRLPCVLNRLHVNLSFSIFLNHERSGASPHTKKSKRRKAISKMIFISTKLFLWKVSTRLIKGKQHFIKRSCVKETRALGMGSTLATRLTLTGVDFWSYKSNIHFVLIKLHRSWTQHFSYKRGYTFDSRVTFWYKKKLLPY